MSRLVQGCNDNNLLGNVGKTKEIVIDLRRGRPQPTPPMTIKGAVVERVSGAKILGMHISEGLSWTTNSTPLAKKVQSRLYFLRKPGKARVRVLLQGHH